MLKITRESAIIAVLIPCLAVAMCLNIWQFNNVREVEKIVEVEVPVEKIVEVPMPIEFAYVPVEVPRKSSLTNFDIRNVGHFFADFLDDDFQFIRGYFSFCDMEWRGYWDCMVTISETRITNCTFKLANIHLLLENCIVENSHFASSRAHYHATLTGVVHLNGTTFLGENIFDVNVVDRGGNVGFENVQFNEGISDWD